LHSWSPPKNRKIAVFQSIGREVAERLSEPAFAERLAFGQVLDHRQGWDALRFVDLCEACGRCSNDRARATGEVQGIEMRQLLEYNCRAALGA
jgi:hypothetical protein